MPSIIQADQLKSADGNTTYLNSGTLSNLTLPSGSISNYVGQTTTISGAQVLDDTFTTVTGSLVSSYTPSTGASKVYYSVTLKVSHADSDTRGIATFIPFLAGSALADATGFAMDTNTGEGSFDDFITFYTLISASGWTTGKNVEVRARRYSSSYDTQLHRNANFRQTDGTEIIAFNNVNVVIYSIM